MRRKLQAIRAGPPVIAMPTHKLCMHYDLMPGTSGSFYQRTEFCGQEAVLQGYCRNHLPIAIQSSTTEIERAKLRLASEVRWINHYNDRALECQALLSPGALTNALRTTISIISSWWRKLLVKLLTL